MSSESSTSDDETSRLEEALDKSLLNDDLFRNGVGAKNVEHAKLPSLRRQNEEVVTANPFSLKVTPEFQKHVSKHLSEMLDKIIDDSETFLKVKRKKQKNGGVKLLFTSKEYLTCDDEVVINGSRKHKRKISGEKVDYEARAKEVAVSPEWVLSKQEVKSWAPSWKNNVEVVKLHNSKKKKKKKKSVNEFV